MSVTPRRATQRRAAAALAAASMWRMRVPVVSLLLALLLPALSAARPGQNGQAGGTEAVAVPPGGVVLWAGEGTSGCVLEGEAVPATAEGCYLTVDLDADETLVAERTRQGRREALRLEISDYPYRTQRLTIKDTRRVNVNEADAARAAEERKRIVATFALRSPRTFELPLHAPLETMPRGGRFGAKRIINGEPRSPHTGSDFGVPQGTPVMAAADATVRLAEEHFFGGNSVFLDHGDGLVTMYLHLHEIFVKPDQQITRGAVLGTVGSTGRSTGPHLHFGVRWRGARVDPRFVLERGAIPSVE